jgi:hypothetical protein
MFIRFRAFPFNKGGQLLAMLASSSGSVRNQGKAMQLFRVIEPALMLVLMVTAGIRNVGQELAAQSHSILRNRLSDPR